MKFDPTLLPDVLPIFPLAGTLLLPRGELPLNIFEPRYLAMVDYALATKSRMIGMVQPRRDDGGPDDLYTIGCVGRINSFHETNDSRYLMTLYGVQRFRIVSELPQRDGFRMVSPAYELFTNDQNVDQDGALDRTKLLALLKEYFKAEGLTCNWDNMKSASDDMLISALSMACPLGPSEKQALLEAKDSAARAGMFISLLEMAVISDQSSDPCATHRVH